MYCTSICTSISYIGEEGGMSTCTVQVSVQDVNDLPPEFIRLPAGKI